MRTADTTVPPTDAMSETTIDRAGRVTPARARSTRAIITFFLFTFAWTWGLWGIVTLTREQAPALGNALYLAGASIPA